MASDEEVDESFAGKFVLMLPQADVKKHALIYKYSFLHAQLSFKTKSKLLIYDIIVNILLKQTIL